MIYIGIGKVGHRHKLIRVVTGGSVHIGSAVVADKAAVIGRSPLGCALVAEVAEIIVIACFVIACFNGLAVVVCLCFYVCAVIADVECG